MPDAFRLYVGDWLAYEWRFEVVRLWEIDARVALQSGEAGPLALVPLMRGGDEPSRVIQAARRLNAMPRAQAADAVSALMAFAARRYDRATFMNVLGKDRVMESWLDQEMAEREARGEARGQIKAARQMCSDLVKEFHPGRAAALLPVIEACDQPETLRSWDPAVREAVRCGLRDARHGKAPCAGCPLASHTAFAPLDEAALTGPRTAFGGPRSCRRASRGRRA